MAHINLSQGQKVLIDDEDYEELNKYKWFAQKMKNGQFYAGRNVTSSKKRTMLLMHRAITKPGNLEIIDHINRNTLDNRKVNLRITDKSGNGHNVGLPKNNTSGQKGVDYKKSNKKFRARIAIRGKQISLGYFETSEEAGEAYKEAKRIITI